MTPRRMIRDSIGFASAQFVVRAVMIVRTVLAARWLGPQVFGVWNALQLVMDYGALAPLGTQQGLDQRVPTRLADADAEALARVKRAGGTNILLLSLLFGALCFAYFMGSSGKIVTYWGLDGILLAMGVVVLSNWAGYHTTVLRSHGNIRAVSLWFFLQGTVGALLGLVLIRWYGGWGLLYGWVGGTLVAFAWTRWQSRDIAPVRPLVGAETMTLLRIGFPMFFYSGSALIIRNLDRLVIIRFLGARELGYYSLAVTAMTLLMYLPDSATYVFYPRLLQRFRAAGSRPELVRDSVIALLRVNTVLTPALGGLAYLFVRDVIAIVLPNFVPGVPAVQVMCFTAGALAFTNMASIVLMTTGRQIVLIPLAVVSVFAFLAADVLTLTAGHGILGVAWATFLAYTVMGTVALALALRSLAFTPSQVARHVLSSLWGLAAAVALAPLADGLAPWARGGEAFHRIAHVGIASIGFLVAYGLLVAPQLRGLGILDIITQFHPALASWLRRGATVLGERSPLPEREETRPGDPPSGGMP